MAIKYWDYPAKAERIVLASTSDHAYTMKASQKVDVSKILSLAEIPQFIDSIQISENFLKEHGFSSKAALDLVEIQYEVSIPDELYKDNERKETIFATYDLSKKEYTITNSEHTIIESSNPEIKKFLPFD